MFIVSAIILICNNNTARQIETVEDDVCYLSNYLAPSDFVVQIFSTISVPHYQKEKNDDQSYEIQ